MIKAIVVTKDAGIYRRFVRLNNLNPDEYPWIYESIKLRGYKDCFAFMLWGSQDTLDLYDFSYMQAHGIQPLYF